MHIPQVKSGVKANGIVVQPNRLLSLDHSNVANESMKQRKFKIYDGELEQSNRLLSLDHSNVANESMKQRKFQIYNGELSIC